MTVGWTGARHTHIECALIWDVVALTDGPSFLNQLFLVLIGKQVAEEYTAMEAHTVPTQQAQYNVPGNDFVGGERSIQSGAP